MALHTYTLASLVSAAKHASGIATPATGSTWANVVNDAIQYMADAHAWSWMERALSLNLVADQEYVALPSDYAGIISLRAPTDDLPIRAMSMDEILRARAANTNLVGTQGYWYAQVWTPQANVTSLPTCRLELWPTPSANATGGLVGRYRRILSALSADTDVPDVPPPWHPPLKHLVRAMAVSTEDEQDGQDWARWNEMLPRLIDLDATQRDSLGPIRGGIGQPRRWNGIFEGQTLS